MTTRHLSASTADITSAADLLSAGKLVAVPTETVYGLAADASIPTAVDAIFTAKGRPANDPLIVHCAPIPDTLAWLQEHEWIVLTPGPLSDLAHELVAGWWPGPLTMVLPRGPRVSDRITAGKPTVALRVPAHPVTQQLLRALGRPVVAPSANRFGRISPTTATHVMQELDGRIDAVLDGGPCPVGVESTIVRPTATGELQLLRPGGCPAEDLAALAPLGIPASTPDTEAQTAPGRLQGHYAPGTSLLPVQAWPPNPPRVRTAVITWRPRPRLPWAHAQRCLTEQGDPREAARQFYATLRDMDQCGAEQILIEDIPIQDGLGRALQDRLGRAIYGSGHHPRP